MTSAFSKDEILRVLNSMNVQLSSETKFSAATLAEKLTKAIDVAQRVVKLVPECVNLDSLEPWEETRASKKSTFLDIYRTCSMDECAHNWIREQTTGEGNVPLYTNVFSDVRQTLMHIAYNHQGPLKSDIFLIEDADKNYSISFRLLGIHALDAETPLLSVIYAHGPGSGVDRAYEFLSRSESVPKITATILEQKLLIKVLEENSKRVASTFTPSLHRTERGYKPSFLLPLRALSSEKIGSLTKAGCVLCGARALSRCSSCQAVSYCGKECQTAHWKEHKKLCKPLSKGTWQRVRFSIPTLGSGVTSMIIVNKNTMPGDIKKQAPSTSEDGPPPNIHGSSPFLVKVQVPVTGLTTGDAGMMVYDRRRTFTGYINRETDPDAYARVENTVRQNGISGLKVYRWAKMVADWTLDICLDVEPAESMQW